MKRLPPMPWAKFEDGDRLGFSAFWRIWKAYLFPYRTYELLGYDEETLELELGSTRWHRPDFLRRNK